MYIPKKISIIINLLAIFIAVMAFGNEATSQQTRRRHHGPPPEAYTACKGKKAGDKADFVSPHGDTVSGVCEQRGDQLILRPDKPPAGRSGDRAHKETDD